MNQIKLNLCSIDFWELIEFEIIGLNNNSITITLFRLINCYISLIHLNSIRLKWRCVPATGRRGAFERRRIMARRRRRRISVVAIVMAVGRWLRRRRRRRRLRMGGNAARFACAALTPPTDAGGASGAVTVQT